MKTLFYFVTLAILMFSFSCGERKETNETARSDQPNQTRDSVRQQPATKQSTIGTATDSSQRKDTALLASEKGDPVTILKEIAMQSLSEGKLTEVTFANRIAKFKCEETLDKSEVESLLERICKSDVKFRAVQLEYYSIFYDRFGKESKQLALKMTYTASTLRMINWDNIYQVDIYKLADDYWYNPKLLEGR
ncbi:MAG: hypothetical protein ACKVRP_02660 [Bacteroidota bacterium]